MNNHHQEVSSNLYEVSNFDFILDGYFGSLLFSKFDNKLGRKQVIGSGDYIISRDAETGTNPSDEIENVKYILIELNDPLLQNYQFAVDKNGTVDLIETTPSGKQLSRKNLPSTDSDRIAHSIAHRIGLQTDTRCCESFINK